MRLYSGILSTTHSLSLLYYILLAIGYVSLSTHHLCMSFTPVTKGISAYYYYSYIITLHAKRGKRSVCLSVCLSMDTKIARSRELGIRASDKRHQVGNGEKLIFLCFFMLDTDHDWCKSCFLIDHAYFAT